MRVTKALIALLTVVALLSLGATGAFADDGSEDSGSDATYKEGTTSEEADQSFDDYSGSYDTSYYDTGSYYYDPYAYDPYAENPYTYESDPFTSDLYDTAVLGDVIDLSGVTLADPFALATTTPEVTVNWDILLSNVGRLFETQQVEQVAALSAPSSFTTLPDLSTLAPYAAAPTAVDGQLELSGAVAQLPQLQDVSLTEQLGDTGTAVPVTLYDNPLSPSVTL